MLYTLQNAATVLDVSISTVRRWIAQDNIRKMLIEIDRPRIYISRSDVMMLSDKHCRKLGTLPKKTKHANNSQNNTAEEQEMYTLLEVANFIGVSVYTVSIWLVASEIEKKYIITDRKRVYISFHDALALAIMHGRKMESRNKGQKWHLEEDFYTVKDVALFIGVSVQTVRRWLVESEIEKKYIVTDKKRVYIHHSDVMLLAKQHQSHISPAKRHEIEDIRKQP